MSFISLRDAYAGHIAKALKTEKTMLFPWTQAHTNHIREFMLANNLFGLANRSEMAVLAAMYGIAIVDVSDDTEPDEIDMYLLKKLKTKVESETKKMITDALVRRSAGNGYVLVDGKAHALEALQLALEGCTGYRAEALAVVKAWAKSSTGSC